MNTETQTTRDVPNAETGLLPCRFVVGREIKTDEEIAREAADQIFHLHGGILTGYGSAIVDIILDALRQKSASKKSTAK